MNVTLEKFGTLDSSEKTIATLGDRWRPQRVKQEGEITKMITSKKSLYPCNIWKNVISAQMLEVSIRSRNGAPSRKGCVVNGQRIKASNK